jgi:glutathione synthase/RimK-type ligase-like ATP-grasp enzyme
MGSGLQSQYRFADVRAMNMIWHIPFLIRVLLISVATRKFELLASKDGLETISYEGNTPELPDVVLVRTGSAIDYFGLAVLRQIERCGVVVINGWQSIEISRESIAIVSLHR